VRLLAATGRRSMACTVKKVLVRFFGWQGDPWQFPWHELRYLHTAAMRSWLASSGYAPATANRAMVAVRGILRQCYRLDQISERDFRLACDGLETVRGSRPAPGRFVPGGELRALFRAIRERSRCPELAARNAALVAVLYGGGLRRAEVCALDLEHVIGVELRVHGKGNKVRLVHLPAGSAAALAAWLALRGDAPGPLFWPAGRSGTVLRPGVRLSADSLWSMLRTLADRAGVPGLTPHDLRRSFVSELLDQGADISTVKEMAGHASVNTTARYDRRGERAKAKASELLCVPFEG